MGRPPCAFSIIQIGYKTKFYLLLSKKWHNVRVTLSPSDLKIGVSYDLGEGGLFDMSNFFLLLNLPISCKWFEKKQKHKLVVERPSTCSKTFGLLVFLIFSLFLSLNSYYVFRYINIFYVIGSHQITLCLLTPRIYKVNSCMKNVDIATSLQPYGIKTWNFY